MDTRQDWHEISCKAWDRLSQSEREIFLTPICGKPDGGPNSQRITFAGTALAIKRLGIRSLRLING